MRYFRPDRRGAVPWHCPLDQSKHYSWEFAPKSGVALPVEVDLATHLLLEAVEAALEAYDSEAPRRSMRAGALLELLADALQQRGGIDLAFHFQLRDGTSASVLARPDGRLGAPAGSPEEQR